MTLFPCAKNPQTHFFSKSAELLTKIRLCSHEGGVQQPTHPPVWGAKVTPMEEGVGWPRSTEGAHDQKKSPEQINPKSIGHLQTPPNPVWSILRAAASGWAGKGCALNTEASVHHQPWRRLGGGGGLLLLLCEVKDADSRLRRWHIWTKP